MIHQLFGKADRCVAVLALSICLASARTVHAQEAGRKPCTAQTLTTDVADHAALLSRAAQLQGDTPPTALTIRRPSTERIDAACDSVAAIRSGTFAITALPLAFRSSYNSAYPVDVNNGALWGGRGLGIEIEGGAELRAGPFSAALYPTVAWQQNRPFRISAQTDTEYSPYAYTGHVIDWPQRFGESAFWTVDPGQSYARVDMRGFAAGVSTENLWMGPALRAPLLLGSSAPGFPHAFIATAKPFDIGFARIEFQLFAGRVSESDYFDADPANDRRVLSGTSAVIEPAFVRGLFVGANRLHMSYEDGVGSYLLAPYRDIKANTPGGNQMISFYARWVHPLSGFEAYAEWAREDGWGDWSDLLREPDHGQAYTLGFQKTADWRGKLRWYGELAHLQAANPLRGGRGVVTLYTHFELLQGQTHAGQMLGAWIGPGSDTQLLGVEHYTDRGSNRFEIERVRYDDDAYYNIWGRVYGHNGHDVSLGATLGHTRMVRDLSISAVVGVAHRLNRNFVYFDGSQPGNYRTENNLRLELDVAWIPRF